MQQQIKLNSKRTFWLALQFSILLCFSGLSQAKSLLSDIRLNTLSKQETYLTFVLSRNEVSTESILPEINPKTSPSRLILTFKDTEYANTLFPQSVNQGGVIAISGSKQLRNTEVVITTQTHYDYVVSESQEGNKTLVTLKLSASNSQATDNTEFVNSLTNIDFKRGTGDSGQLILSLENSNILADMKKESSNLIISLPDTSLPKALLYQLDVSQFGSIVKQVETFSTSKGTKLIVSNTGHFQHQSEQLGNMLVISINKPLSNQALAGSSTYTGSLITLNFQDIPVRKVLQILADHNEFNLVLSDNVTGNVTVRLKQVPWDQALDIILKIRGLDKRLEQNVLLIAPQGELLAQETEALEAQRKAEEVEQLSAEYIQINYAKAKDIAALIQSDATSLLSKRGAVTLDERTNLLVVKDTSDNIETITQAVKLLDRPVQQVLIEARIITVKDDFDEEFGVRFGFTDQQGDDGISGSLDAAQTVSNSTIPNIADRLNVNLPAQTSGASRIGFHVAKLADGTILDLELSAIEAENRGEIIASPRITTANHHRARIEQGTEIPYQEATSSGATSITFKKAVLSLEVTPHVTPDGRVIMDLEITQDTPTSLSATNISIDAQRLKTQVLVDNGETIVLGGIYQQENSTIVSKVPLLGDIPYLQRLFRRDLESNTKKELLIFVTPKILTESF